MDGLPEMKLPDIGEHPAVSTLVETALAEDVGPGDVTTQALVPADVAARAAIVSRGDYVVSGNDVAELVFASLDPEIQYCALIKDGSSAREDACIATIEGNARAMLTAERSALNFMQRMTGIASLTKQFVEIASKYNTAILDTRKTTPGHRVLEKYAVLCGGGKNHRFGLHDMVLIKDNHLELWRGREELALADAVAVARESFPGVRIEIEVEDEDDLLDALEGRPDWILLDNMEPARMTRCAELVKGACRLEASGGINLDNVEDVAKCGVDAISLGCLTHSVLAADLALEIVEDEI